MKKYGAGQLDRAITIQVKTETYDKGHVTVAWADLEDRPCMVEPKDSREYQDALKVYSSMTMAFRIRYGLFGGRMLNADLHQIKYVADDTASPPELNFYNIFPPIEIGRRRYLLIPATLIQ